MSTGGNYGTLGYIDDTATTDALYVRRDDYYSAGQIGTYDTTIGDFNVVPPGANGYILTARPALSTGMAWEAPAAGAITVNGSTFLTVSGSPVSLGGTISLTNTALDDRPALTGCWGAGNSIVFGAGTTYTMLIGNSCSSAASVDNSVALGYGARVGGDECVSIGLAAGAIASTGPRNIYIGTSTGAANTSATGRNVFIGYNAGLYQTASANAIIIGADAGVITSTNTASQVVCIGASTVVRDQSVIIGHSASAATSRSLVIGWSASSTQAGCTALGDGCGVSGTNATGVGASASVTGASAIGIGNGVVASTSCTVIGTSAGGSTGTNGVYIGHDAADNSPGADLVAIGYQSGRGLSAAIGTYVGMQAGNACTGGQNTFIGWKAGSTTTTGILNTLVGHNVLMADPLAQNAVCVGAGSSANSNTTVVGQGATAGGTSAISIGQGSSCAGTTSVTVGASATCAGTTSVSIGGIAAAAAANDVCVGYSTKSNGTTVAVGSSAGSATAFQSVCVGYQSGDASAGAVTAIGYRAGRGVGVTNGTFVGGSAGVGVTGVGNTIIGLGSGFTLTTGTSNTIIGNAADAAFGSVGAGTAVGASASVGGSENSAFGFNSLSTGSNGTALGGRSKATNTATLSVGWTSEANAANSSAIGANALASGAAATALGQGSTASGTNSTVLGAKSTASSNFSTAIGVNVTNSVASRTLIGEGTTPLSHIVESTGFLRANSWYSCKAGRNTGTQVVTFPGPVTLTIANTFWTNGCAVSGNNITMPQANTQFSVNAWVKTSAISAPALGIVNFRIRYFDGTTTSTISETTVTTQASAGNVIAWCCNATVQTPNVTTAYAFCELERLTGTTTSVDVAFYALTVKRDA